MGGQLKILASKGETREPLAHFLFLLMVEGIRGLVSSTEEINLFSGFRVGISIWCYLIFSMPMTPS